MFKSSAQVLDCLENGFYGKKLLVIGDLMLDRHVWGKVSRISPEAPVPVVLVLNESETAGGAGNVALNVSGLDLNVSICGFVGSDSNGLILKNIFENSGIGIDGIVECSSSTITKTRIIGGHQQMLRLDNEENSPYEQIWINKLKDSIKSVFDKSISAVILSDYAKGTLTPQVCSFVINRAKEFGVPVFVDPKGIDYEKYSGATAITPNRAEVGLVSRVSPDDIKLLIEAGKNLREKLELEFVLLTLGERGLALIKPDFVEDIPTVARDVFDVSGAGDTVIATLACGIAAGLALEDSVRLANHAAGIIVGKSGTVQIKRNELLNVLTNGSTFLPSDKICLCDELRERINKWKSRGEIVSLVKLNLIESVDHAAANHLQSAKQQCDRLIIGLPNDPDWKKTALLLSALACVDSVFPLEDDNLEF